MGSGYTVLIAGLLHASFNASESTKLDVFDGEWQRVAAVIVLLGILAAATPSRTLRARPAAA
ncbi:hypothetical protein [Pseudarthrobacter sp. NamB4]|uniref:hypothetical protein n=1 Tax=Pseudarthrobacter sp. NamB4 TaxID=2576837 RepID=UPI0010FDA250|nr:hypothetical protein [Pseudarthrobacter sp. NamB4]TLM72954.1 hypothetical protein FDW81_11420 [Pseudarthrobacter sp. NamB4]